MDDDVTIAGDLTPPRRPLQAPAFLGSRWNIWSFFVLLVLGALVLFLTQTIAVAVIILRDHPELIGNPMARSVFSSRTFLLELLSAKNLFVVTCISDSMLAFTALGGARIAFGATLRQFGLIPGPRAGLYAVGVAAGLGLTLITAGIEYVIESRFGSHPQLATLALAKHHGSTDFVLDFLSVSVFAPIAEEIFFRGFIFAGLAQRMPWGLAAVISAVLFSAAHFAPWSSVPIFVVGLGLACVYYFTRSLRINIVTHATFNALSLILAYSCPQCIK